MSGFKTDVVFLMFLWSFNPSKGNDKVWGYARVGEKYYSFHGKRGTDATGLKTLRFKRGESSWALSDVGKAKLRSPQKGYVSYSTDPGPDSSYPEIERVYPGFVAHMREQLMMARLSGAVRAE